VGGRSFIVVPIALKNFLLLILIDKSFSPIARKIVGRKSCEGMQEKIYLIQNKIYYDSFYSRKTKLLAFS
jgi:hypothetical protein